MKLPVRIRIAVILVSLGLACLVGMASAQTLPTEIHDRISLATGATNRVALTLDACSGAFDEDLVLFLVRNRIPATLFATKKRLDKNPVGVAILKSNLDLFDIEDHGENHIPAVIGVGRKVYGIAGFSVNADAGASLGSQAVPLVPAQGLAAIGRVTSPCHLGTLPTTPST